MDPRPWTHITPLPFPKMRIPYFCAPAVMCMVDNNAGTPTQLQAPPPNCYYEKIKSVVAKTKTASEEVAKALLGSNAVWHRGAPRHLEGRVLSWEGRRGTHSPAGSSASCAPGTTTITHLCCFPLHHCDPGRSVDLSWTHTGPPHSITHVCPRCQHSRCIQADCYLLAWSYLS